MSEKITQFKQVEITAPAFDAYPQENIVSGALGSNRINQTQEVGTFQSENYKRDVSGWMLSPNEAQMPSLVLIGSLKYGKTSWTDSTNVGYYLGAEGAYFGSATDATILKFAIGDGSLQVSGSIVTGAGSDIKGQYIDSLSVSKLTTGTILSKAITMSFTEGAGDCKIQAGKTDFTYDESGFIMGIDDSDDNKVKFIIGNATEYLAVIGDTFINTLKIGGYDVGNNVLIEADTERSNASPAVYTKVKEIQVGRNGNYRISFDYKAYNGGTPSQNRNAYFRACYANGYAYEIGTLSLNIGQGVTTAYATQTYDYTGAVTGQALSLWVLADGGVTTYVKNFKLEVAATNEIVPPSVLLD